MKLLLAGTSYIRNEKALYLVNEWMRMGRRLNGDSVDMILVDSFNPNNLTWGTTDGVEKIQLPDDVGHLNSTGRDGWGRATMHALQYAIDKQYDMVALYDADLMFTRAIRPYAEMMWTAESKVASVIGTPCAWLEGIFIFNVEWMAERDVIGLYDWKSRVSTDCAEVYMEQAIGRPRQTGHNPDPDSLWILPIIGRREDGGLVRLENMQDVFPFGCDWLTHCQDFRVYEALAKRYCPY